MDTDTTLEKAVESAKEIIMVSDASEHSTEDEDENPEPHWYKHIQVCATLQNKSKNKDKYKKLVDVIKTDERLTGLELVTLAGETATPGPSSKKKFRIQRKSRSSLPQDLHFDAIYDQMTQSNLKDLVSIPETMLCQLNQGPFMIMETRMSLGAAHFPDKGGLEDVCIQNMCATEYCIMTQQELADVEQAALFSLEAMEMVTVCREILRTWRHKKHYKYKKIHPAFESFLDDTVNSLRTTYAHVVVRRRRELLQKANPRDRINRLTQRVSNTTLLIH